MREHIRKQNSLLLAKSDMNRIEELLEATAHTKLSTSFNESYAERHQEINNQLHQHFLDCIDAPSTFNTTIDELGGFLKHIVRQEYDNFINCTESLNHFLQGIQ